ncbi:DUF4247 domain-containing protein [Kibdelosporangium philippinense]|uniref:DUF4247 domain-containing protein n=1 Tax=Kibdelosporangium philippinense TaxID=211113 RepID=A0ABS8ZA97_9PSEU|nr:DUF4247 domain-containing protein [Kibdelosporangium philippinense]MCE7004801.1 DUF4247 domain-containing protein [Kibdelosporangium philippinense]
MKYPLWFVVGGILAVICLIVAGNLMVSGPTVATFIEREFEKDVSPDDDIAAYKSQYVPTSVSARIARTWTPLSQTADSSGIYLRYSRDAVVIRPIPTGSSIHVLEVERAHRTYSGHTGGSWGWTSTYGSDFRGRGPGAGK